MHIHFLLIPPCKLLTLPHARKIPKNEEKFSQNELLQKKKYTVREAQNHGLMKDTKRTASGATPLRRAKYPRLRGLLRRASRTFLTVVESDQPARLFASFSTFFFQTKKKVIVPPSKGFL